MKSINLRRIATAGVGAALLAASAAAAVSVDETGLANFKLFNNAEPNLKIVVGAASMPSDAVAAANIAAMIGNLAYTSSDITVLGKDALSCEGGAGGSVSGTSVDVEVTTAGVNPNVAYQMKTYVGGFLDADSIDDRADDMTGASILSSTSPYASGGRKITNYESSALVYKGTLTDSEAGRTYTEEEHYFVYGQSTYDDNARAVLAKGSQLGYETVFTNPIAACTDVVPSTTTELCSADSYRTYKHRVKIKFLGSDWIIYGMDLFPADGGITGGSTKLTLGKEVQYKEFMQIGDEATAPNGVKLTLKDISGMTYGTNYQPAVSFDIFDANGNKIDTATLQPGSEYNKNGMVVRVWNAFVGTGGSAYAQVSIFSDKLELTSGVTINTDNSNWIVTLIGGGTSYGASLARIQLVRQSVISDLNAGDFLTFVQKPAVMKLTYTGLEPVTYDALTMSGTSGNLYLGLTGDTRTTGVSYVQLTSGLTNPFNMGTTSTNTIYYVTDGTPAGAASVGSIFYNNPSLGMQKYYGTGSNSTVNFTSAHGALSGTITGYLRFGDNCGANATFTSLPTNIGAAGTQGLYLNGTLSAENLTSVTFTQANNASATGANLSINSTCAALVGFTAATGTINWANSDGATAGLNTPVTDTAFNYVPYTYGSNTRNIEFNSNALQQGDMTYTLTNKTVMIPEFREDNDVTTTVGAVGIDISYASATPKFAPTTGTSYGYYGRSFTAGIANQTAYMLGQAGAITDRGSTVTVSSSSVQMQYATTLAHSLYTLSGSETIGAGNVATETLSEGESVTGLYTGESVLIKAINAGVSGGTGGDIAGADGLTCTSDQAYVVNALDTSIMPLVVTDTSGMASGTETMILVGGPLVNTLTAQVPGFATMVAGDAVVKVVGDKVVVAGYTASDTTSAANSLISWLASNKNNLVR